MPCRRSRPFRYYGSTAATALTAYAAMPRSTINISSGVVVHALAIYRCVSVFVVVGRR